MLDVKQQITDLAELMEEFRLGEAQLRTEDLLIAFRRRATAAKPSADGSAADGSDSASAEDLEEDEEAEPAAPKGVPISSPMNGIFYGSPSPASPPFVREGEEVQPGQVVGLIEAMKVFNEIQTTMGGVVTRIVAETGAIVQPGDVLLYVG